MKKIITLLSVAVPFAALADDAQIEQFMKAFHENPQEVMDRITG